MNDSCEHYDCQNPTACFRCFEGKLYKPPKNRSAGLKKTKKVDFALTADNSWEGLEGECTKDLNKIPSYYDAKRQLQSGAQWWAQGDIADPIVFLECKERIGNVSESRGTKSFTIEKEWLEKGEDEAKHAGGKPFFLPFRFKGDATIRTVTKWDWIAEIVCMLKAAMIENDKKDVLIKAYKKKIKELGGNDESIE